ncbi:DNA cross-link repair protein PSO2 KNAG_0E02110 [Huiozyma naganishii CBS 8797]|uniref:Metallo-beta-lactamase domain-containing protein n=1 Tax=Huiozyma naganishii (strain ATCC MYA-139 / BCRC 22969 / CBS 8797 / KCTC 17520 / NBRC 10181 / NCYC 3082 / Yp74L-3) TaxID=1071383 RepID=J7RLS7_HUIN7|nr:hypothetical protein KNAG_0E02110 [Kazachstania naganishii CBS 8797]CCK70473.1 hypothetical protein KNAG_0E02110 [Kazachstania naganishii CBS 8797]
MAKRRSIIELQSIKYRYQGRSPQNAVKKQRKLNEFDIPSARTLPVKRPCPIINDADNPILLDDVGGPEEVESSDEVEEMACRETVERKDVGPRGLFEARAEIACPICGVDLSLLELYAREAHCDLCLGAPPARPQGGSKVNSPKKQTGDHTTTPRPRRRLPAYKILEFTNGHKLVVDGFNYEKDDCIKEYFLSHFHSDHYQGLKKSWGNGEVYCSYITAQLLCQKFNFPRELVHILNNGERTMVHDRISVVPLDANHCPGAQIFLFQEHDGAGRIVKQIIHTGDFRATDAMVVELEKFLPSSNSVIDEIYLDTTYMKPNHTHPTQQTVVDVTSSFVTEDWYSKKRPRTVMDFARATPAAPERRKMVLVGSYVIGKEKLALEIARRLDTSVHVQNKNKLRQIVLDGQMGDAEHSQVHMVPLGILRDDAAISTYLREECRVNWLNVDVIGVVPTGWTFGNRYSTSVEIGNKCEYVKGAVTFESTFDKSWFSGQETPYRKFQIYKVPYSEHSNFVELLRFLCALQWERVIPTVNVNRYDEMNEWFQACKKSNALSVRGFM